MSNLSFLWLLFRLLLCYNCLTRFGPFYPGLFLLIIFITWCLFLWSLWLARFLYLVWFLLSLSFFLLSLSDILQFFFADPSLFQFLISFVRWQSRFYKPGLLLQELGLIIDSHGSLSLHFLLHLPSGQLLLECHNSLELFFFISLVFLRFVFIIIFRGRKGVVRLLIFVIVILSWCFDLLLLDLVIWLLIFCLLRVVLVFLEAGFSILNLAIIALVNDTPSLDTARRELFVLSLNIISVSIHGCARHLRRRGHHHSLRLSDIWRKSHICKPTGHKHCLSLLLSEALQVTHDKNKILCVIQGI